MAESADKTLLAGHLALAREHIEEQQLAAVQLIGSIAGDMPPGFVSDRAELLIEGLQRAIEHLEQLVELAEAGAR